jgi:hypothetical protein
VTVLTVKLNPEGKAAFHCATATFTALRVGGTDEEPQVVPLSTSCVAGSLLQLKVGAKETASNADAVEPAKP